MLKSWAVPKGPSLDPAVKRLAMHVEDHPMEYGSFEGIIPKGQYGGGTVMLWDKGEWIPQDQNPNAAFHKGDMTFRLRAKKLNGLWKLIRIRNNEKGWLLIKIKDEYAKPAEQYDITVDEPNSVKSKQSMEEITTHYQHVWGKHGLEKPAKKVSPKKKVINKSILNLPTIPFPDVIFPEFATLVDKPPEGDNWLHEIKLDGYRLLALKKSGQTRLITRRQNDWTHKFKDIARAINHLPFANAILDGEIVLLDEHQRSNFQLLQNAIKTNLGKPLIYYVFDLIYYDQHDLSSLPLLERKNILQQIIPSDDALIRYNDHLFGSGSEILAKACELSLEGIVSKDIQSPYVQRRTKQWLKTKCLKQQEFVIGGYNKPKGRRQYFGSLLLGTYNQRGELIYHGNVGTGFTEASLKSTDQLLKKNQVREMPFAKRPPGASKAIWVKPVLVAEIEFSEWTDENYLRHPSFKGLRNDKPAREIVQEQEIEIEKIMQKKPKKITTSPLKITNPNKLLYPEDRITKQQVAAYYQYIEPWIMPYIVHRPLTIVRCPEGYQKCFYQKHINQSTPKSLYGIRIKEKENEEDCIYIKDHAGLMAFPQMGVLEIHPWGSNIDRIEYPDMMIFDLDPGPQISWKTIVKAALEIRQYLQDLKLTSFIKTTGGKGLHIVVPIQPEYDWDQVGNFAEVFVNFLVKTDPTSYVSKMTKAKRVGKIYVDYLRNRRGATAIAPYSTRARPYAPVATPIDWDELSVDMRDNFFNLKTIHKRLDTLKSDPWKNFFKQKQSLRLDQLMN